LQNYKDVENFLHEREDSKIDGSGARYRGLTCQARNGTLAQILR
jgi:hypothetical protein